MKKIIAIVFVLVAVLSFGCGHLARDKNGHLLTDATGHFVTKKELSQEQERERIKLEKKRARVEKEAARIAKRESKQKAHERARPSCKYVRINGMACAPASSGALRQVDSMSDKEYQYFFAKYGMTKRYISRVGETLFGCADLVNKEGEVYEWTNRTILFFFIPLKEVLISLRGNVFCPGQGKPLLLPYDGGMAEAKADAKAQPPAPKPDNQQFQKSDYQADSQQEYIYFAAKQPPEPHESNPDSRLCYRFSTPNLQEQADKLQKKYGVSLYKAIIEESSTGGRVLIAERVADNGKTVSYRYFTDPKACDLYQEALNE
jgi:hypothetical protein